MSKTNRAASTEQVTRRCHEHLLIADALLRHAEEQLDKAWHCAEEEEHHNSDLIVVWSAQAPEPQRFIRACEDCDIVFDGEDFAFGDDAVFEELLRSELHRVIPWRDERGEPWPEIESCRCIDPVAVDEHWDGLVSAKLEQLCPQLLPGRLSVRERKVQVHFALDALVLWRRSPYAIWRVSNVTYDKGVKKCLDV